ncbi:hypothetical protein GW930_02525 [Candidatus Saccharibacteria bacterium]|nr:hypothetical protein [Candidatus Saccharibacteria bacterium]
MLPRIVTTVSVVSLAVLLTLVTFTTPATAGPLGLLAIFISAYVFLVGVISLFLSAASRLIAFFSVSLATSRPIYPLPFKRAYYYSSVLAMAPVMLIGLQSVGSVGLYEIILVIAFEVVACVYISRRIP